MNNSFCYGFIIYRINKDNIYEFLILKSSQGHHDFPKGHKDKEDKNKLATAKRETYEESGLSDLKIIDNFSVTIDYIIPKFDTHKFVELFLAEYLSGEVVLSNEHTAYKWYDFESALNVLEFDNSKTALTSAYNYLEFTA